ncbi:MAG: hypothetical protein ACYTEZ_10005 [Planctomycetota bacterium]|jgi:hypothetical protein
MRTTAVWALPLLLALLGGGAAAQAREAPWALTFTHGALEVHSLTYKDGTARSFYYMTFKLENKSKMEAKLALHIKALVGSHPKKQRSHVASPEPDAEESIRRLARANDLKNVQQINQMGTMAPGESARGIAVLGTFDREWDVTTVTVYGLAPASLHCRIRKYGDIGFTLAHRAYHRHNRRVWAKAGSDPQYTEVHAIVKHNVVWRMKFHREGDEYAPHIDPIIMDSEGWDVIEDPPPTIVLEKANPFGS